MRQIADLHSHSHYSRATSGLMELHELARWAKIKGVDILGTGDFQHPRWFEELKAGLKETEPGSGIYEHDGMKWILQTEISLIYTQDKIGRRVHHLILSPGFEIAAQINEWLGRKGRLDYDGRPTFAFSSIELVEAMAQISPEIAVIPAHAWTPWFSIFGSRSGFNSMEECFGDKAKHIYAFESGLSSDPAMNWRISKLDGYTIISNSDSHSPYPWRLGREANVFDLKEVTYKSLLEAIKTRRGFEFTVETPPEYGKYHLDGHRSCNVVLEPQQSKALNSRCPSCGGKLTIGVLSRVEELADRPPGFRPKGAVGFKSLIPLSEILSALLGGTPGSKKIMEVYSRLISAFGSEFNVLLDAPCSELEKFLKEKVVLAILRNREGKLKIQPGYDGVYGKPIFDFSVKNAGLGEFV